MKTSFKVCGKDIIISRDDWQAITTNHRDLYSIVSKKEWRKDSHGYIVNSSLGYLHRYVMQFWYGEEMLHEMTKCGFVVDHLNNNPEDCRLSNLEFLRKAYNTAKGQVFDVDSKNAKKAIALTLFKDFSTGCYQITIGCNATIIIKIDGQEKFVNSIYFLYDCDYSIVINDAENILREFETEGSFSIQRTNACDCQVEFAPAIELTEEEKNCAFIWREGIPYLVLGTGKALIDSIHYNEGWEPPKK